ncbi:hypothetical protein APHAL10511_004913 [Amanita phalloides]|nr:hypothetical protein APHAL10511_004913 [Amanita phalloides]
MHTTAVATLQDGTEFTYVDSGLIEDNPLYTTIVFLHGSAFNGRTFDKIHPLASKYGLRTIAIQRKDYAGSTRFTEQELDDLRSGRQTFLDRLAVVVAHLLKHLISELGIPKINQDGKGGVVLLGWSMGTSTAITIFKDLNVVLPELHDFLMPFMKNLVLFDPPYLSFGMDLPSDVRLYNPWLDPEPSTAEERYGIFLAWVSSYTKVPKFDDWYQSGDINALDGRKRADHASVDNWSTADLEYMCEPETAARCEFPMYMPPMQKRLRELAQHVLFEGTNASTAFPAVPVTHIIAGRSCWQCMWGSYMTKKMYEDSLREGKAVRPMKFVVMDEANHFIHTDSPDDLVKAIIDGAHL